MKSQHNMRCHTREKSQLCKETLVLKKRLCSKTCKHGLISNLNRFSFFVKINKFYFPANEGGKKLALFSNLSVAFMCLLVGIYIEYSKT